MLMMILTYEMTLPPALVEDDYNVTPDSYDVISLNDPAPQVSKELWQSFPSHQKLSDLS